MHTIGIAVIAALATVGVAQQNIPDRFTVEWARCCVVGSFPATPGNPLYCRRDAVLFERVSNIPGGRKELVFDRFPGECTTVLTDVQGISCFNMLDCYPAATAWLEKYFNPDEQSHSEITAVLLIDDGSPLVAYRNRDIGGFVMPVHVRDGKAFLREQRHKPY